MNLVHLNSLDMKKILLPKFSGLITHFLVENRKTRTNNLHHWKAGSLRAKGFGCNIYKKVVQ